MSVHEKSVIVSAPVHEVYQMWTNFDDFPKFISHIREVKMLSPTKSHWRAKMDGIEQEWDAETTRMEEDKAIAWECISGLENRGEVRFDQVDSESTRVTVHFEYNPPAGILGDVADVVYVGREFEQSLEEDLRHFKERVESR